MTYNLPPTKKLAEAAGSKKYFTGQPCKHGHVAPRYTQSGTCSACIRASVDAGNATLRANAPQSDTANVADTPPVSSSITLLPTKIRSRPHLIEGLRRMASCLVTLRDPSLSPQAAYSNRPGTDPAGGTFVYMFYLHPDDIPFMYAEGNKTARSNIDIKAHRREIFGKSVELTDEERDNEPEFKP